jgi:hypothetical protein
MQGSGDRAHAQEEGTNVGSAAVPEGEDSSFSAGYPDCSFVKAMNESDLL